MPNSERAEIALLIARGVEIRGRHRMRMTLPWKGPKAGREHDPRIFRWVGLTVRGQRWRVLGVHLPFGKKPKTEALRRIARWLRHSKIPEAALGDYNLFEHVVAQAVEGKVTGYRIDLNAYRNCKLVKKIRLGKHGSDHHAMLYVLEYVDAKGRKHHLTLIAWNVERGHSVADVRAAIEAWRDRYHPDVFALTETYLLHGHLGGLGYQVVQLAPKPKGAKK